MQAKAPVLYLNIGEVMVSPDPAVISTVLGSCVSVCLFSPATKIGGMIHYAHSKMLAKYGQDEDFRYGEIAIPALVDALIAMTGGTASSFSAKIVGGASEISDSKMNGGMGLENINIARSLIKSYGIKTIGEDVGGSYGRKVLFHTASGRLQVANIISQSARTIWTPPPPAARSPAPEEATFFATKILAIGASTGGTEALKVVMAALPARIPPTLIVQHIPPAFSKAFADRLNELCAFEVREAEDGDELRPSLALVAPGGKQMKVEQAANGLFVRLTDEAPVNRHKPSVDYLFHSVASVVGKDSVGVILTGMGVDGAKGLLAMRNQGAQTIAQDEASSVVYGMPKAAFEVGAAQKVRALDDVANEIIAACLPRR